MTEAAEPSIILTPEEVIAISGGYKRAAEQLQELHRQGFWRARRSPTTGQIILERSHYVAVCTGAVLGSSRSGPQPKLRLR